MAAWRQTPLQFLISDIIFLVMDIWSPLFYVLHPKMAQNTNVYHHSPSVPEVERSLSGPADPSRIWRHRGWKSWDRDSRVLLSPGCTDIEFYDSDSKSSAVNKNQQKTEFYSAHTEVLENSRCLAGWKKMCVPKFNFLRSMLPGAQLASTSSLV